MKQRGFLAAYGPYALVAGGSDGLGAAFAEAAAKRGLGLVLVARSEGRLLATAERLAAQYNVAVVPVVADLADFEAARASIEACGVEIGLLIYNAAYAPIGAFADTDAEKLALAAAVNVRAPLLLAKWVSAGMIERGRGGIVLMSSLAGGQGSPDLAAYSATKSFNAVLAQGLWYELRRQGVDVLACCAGAISTPGYASAGGGKPAPGTMSPAAVAEQTLAALGRGPVVVPGAVNKLARFVLSRVLSIRGAIALMAKNTGGLS